MKITSCCVFGAVLMISALNGQAQIQILKETIAKIEGFKSVAYTAISTANNPFSDELYDTKAQVKLAWLGDTAKPIAYYIAYQSKSSNGFTENSSNIFNQKNLLLLNHVNKTYQVKKDYKDPNLSEYNIYNLVKHLNSCLKSSDFDISQLKDTVLNKQACYHITIKTKTLVFQKTDSYNNIELLISKSSNLPLYWKSNQQGVMEKGGMKIGVVKMNSLTYASGYRINTLASDAFNLNIPKGFSEEKPPLPILSAGTPAPNWQLTDTEGKKLTMASLKGKIVLLDITSTSCPACALSVGPLNNLYEKYKGTGVVIISINLDDTRQTVANFKSKNKVEYPVYLDGKAMKTKYQVSAIPVFYVVDQQGIIYKAYEGFFENFEEKVSAAIQKLM
jgi:peroxiredoxin